MNLLLGYECFLRIIEVFATDILPAIYHKYTHTIEILFIAESRKKETKFKVEVKKRILQWVIVGAYKQAQVPF